MDETYRILVVDDHPALRSALAYVLDRQPGFRVIGEAGSLEEARRMFADVDLAVVDLHLPDGDGADLISELLRTNSSARALVLTESLDRTEHGLAVEAGAAGVMHKGVSLAEIIDALHRLAAGEALLSQGEVIELLKLATNHREHERKGRLLGSRLTPREKEVLQALADGLDSEQLAERLDVAQETAHTHMVRLFTKLGVHSRTEALVFALRHDLVKIQHPENSAEGSA